MFVRDSLGRPQTAFFGREMTSGFIFDVKRFALHDGPGLRTTLFMKGCSLSCLGCHNPEGQGVGPELIFRPDRCTVCGDCIPACPHEALSLANGQLEVDRTLCEMAGKCVEACLPGALEIVGRKLSVDEALEILEDDRIYYDESRGGVTLSGGEPFSQPEFLKEVLIGCRERDLKAVLDTCGHVAPDLFKEIAPLANHLLFDLKLLDEERHEAFTGVHNRWILENLRWAATLSSPSLTVRIPLIPGVNDDRENLQATAEFLAGLLAPPTVDLLPYHRLGVDKYERMGREYELSDIEPPPTDQLDVAVRFLEDSGLSVTVRGELYGHE